MYIVNSMYKDKQYIKAGIKLIFVSWVHLGDQVVMWGKMLLCTMLRRKEDIKLLSVIIDDILNDDDVARGINIKLWHSLKDVFLKFVK